MEINLENIKKSWVVLNTSQFPEEKKLADIYLLEFKKSPSAFELCVQLLEQPEKEFHLLAAMVIQQTIRERIIEISESKELFFKFRDIIFHKILEKVKSSPALDRICLAMSSLMLIGVITYWPEAIEDILQYAESSVENLHVAVIMFENLNKELNELNISAKTQFRIKDILIDKSKLIQDFILFALSHNITGKILNQTIELTHAWVKLGLNTLKHPRLSRGLINVITNDNIKYVSDVFAESLTCATCAKIYTNIPECNLDEYIEKCDKEELQSVEFLVDMIKAQLMQLGEKRLNLDQLELLNGLGNIFAAICENFIFLFFLKDARAQNLLEMFFYFISNKNRKVSYKFFESINELREFINREYKFNNLNDAEKIEFCNYLLRICENVMINSKLKVLNVSLSQMTRKECLIMDEFQSLSTDKENEDENEIELESYEISVSDYRKNSEDVFYNIFLIFLQNFSEPGADFFFGWINKIISDLGVNDTEITNDEKRLIVVEVVLHVVKSIMDCYESLNLSCKPVIDFTLYILNSKILLNDKMILNFLLFLDQASPYVSKDVNLYQASINFLLLIGENKQLEKVATYILLTITDFAKHVNLDVFNSVYAFYFKNYDNFLPASLTNLSEALCNIVGIKNDDGTQEGIAPSDVISYFNGIVQPATERILKTYDYLAKNLEAINEYEYKTIKSDLLKNYSIHHSVLKKSYFLSKEILKEVFHRYMNDLGEVTQTIFKLFSKDSSVIKELTKVYIKVVHHLCEDAIMYFDSINDMMIGVYLANNENYSSLYVLKFLYSETTKASPEKRQQIGESYMSLCDVINKNILVMQKDQINVIDAHAQLFVRITDTVSYLKLNSEVLMDTIKLFLDANRNIVEISMNKNVVRALSRIMSSPNIFPREIIGPIYSDIIYNVYEALDHYDSALNLDLVNFTINAINFDENLFVSSMTRVFSLAKFKMFQQSHVSVIVKYMVAKKDNEKSIRSIISEVMNIVKGMGQLEAINNFAIELSIIERKQKFK